MVRRALLLLVVLATFVTTGCGTNGLNFFTDDRLDIVAPKDRSELEAPVDVRWTVKDFAVGERAGSFGVFLDRSPQPPGKTLAWMFRDNDSCKATPGCPDADFLADRNIFTTTDTNFEVVNVPRDTGDQRRRFHEVTVVLLDRDGRRVGEGAWTVEFRVPDND